ncbi:recombinase family protein, partial [Xanthomonas citri pv. citri]
TADKLQQARKHIANGINVREAATRLKVSKTALYAALQSTSAGVIPPLLAVARSGAKRPSPTSWQA